MEDTTPISEIYDIFEEKMGLSPWVNETDIQPINVAEECGRISNSTPVVQSYMLAHSLFGDPRTLKRLSAFFLESSGNVVDNTHPFDVIQIMLQLLVCSRINMEVVGDIIHYRDSAVLYPWGTTHLRQILHFPVKLLDIRGKEAIGALLAKRHFTQTKVDTSTNSLYVSTFLYNRNIQRVYDHWKPIIVALFLWLVKDDLDHISPIRDVREEFNKLITLICRHGLSEPPEEEKKLKSNGFFTFTIPPQDGEKEPTTMELPEKPSPNVPNTLGNYEIILPWETTKKVPKDYGNITIRRMYGDDARLLSYCWEMALTRDYDTLFEDVFTLLVGKIYPRALTFRVGPPPEHLSEEKRAIEEEMEEKEEKKKEIYGEYPGEVFYYY